MDITKDKEIVRFLLRRTAEGDHEAFNELYRILMSTVKKWIYGIIKDRAAVEELAQDIMADIWFYAARLDVDRNLKYWVLRNAKNKIIDKYRRRKRATLVDFSDESAVTVLETLSGYIDNDLENAVVYKLLLERLREPDKTVFFMKYYKYPTEVIAEKLKLSNRQVAYSFRRAAIFLRKELKKKK